MTGKTNLESLNNDEGEYPLVGSTCEEFIPTIIRQKEMYRLYPNRVSMEGSILIHQCLNRAPFLSETLTPFIHGSHNLK
jgi:hypothetical protein